MKHPNHPTWVRRAAGLSLAAALLLCLFVPVLQSREVTPENPIREENVTALRTVSLSGDADGLRQEQAAAAPGEQGESGGKGAGRLSGQETDTPVEPDAEHGDPDTPPDQPEEPEPGDRQPEQTDPSMPEQPADGEPRPGEDEPVPGDAGGMDAEGDPAQGDQPGGGEETQGDLDLGLVMTWYKYGQEEKRLLCPGGSAVAQTVLTTQLPDGALRYGFELYGLDADDAELTSLTLRSGAGAETNLPFHGWTGLSLGPGGARTEYDFRAEALYTRTLSDGSRRQETVTFRIVIVYEDGLDLELAMEWSLPSGSSGSLSCMPGRSAARTIRSGDITDSVLSCGFYLRGESAASAELTEVSYASDFGERGTLKPRGGALPLQCPEGDRSAYTITALAVVNNGGARQTVAFTFVIEWQQALDVQLAFTWLKNSVTPQTLTVRPGERASAAVKRGDLKQDTLSYQLALTGSGAGQAAIVSVMCEDSGGSRSVSAPDGQIRLTIPEGASSEKCEFTVQVRCQEPGGGFRMVDFTVALRYSGDVSLQMEYTLKDGERRTVRCDAGRSRTEEPVYDDQVPDGGLPFALTLLGTDAGDGVSILSVECYQSGSGRQIDLGSGGTSCSGSAALLTNEDGSTGENTFTVTAGSPAGQRYVFTINIPYKHRGQGVVRFQLNVEDGQRVTNGTELTLRVEAWSETADGQLLSRILENGLTVTLDGEPQRCTGLAGYAQQYTLVPKNPEIGDENTHVLVITGEDDYGNHGELTLHLTGERTEKGAVKGTATIYIDMSVLGLGITEVHSYQVLSGEPVSYVVAKAVWDYDAGDPFGTAADSFGWPEAYAAYNGSLDHQFYLARLGDGSDLARRVNALSGSWSDYGGTEEEIFARIDGIFGEDSPYAALWRSIYRKGYQMNPSETYSVGEFDFTQASGWMYSIGGGTFYPGTAMSGYELEDGDVLVLRYTLAYGSDIGGGQRGSDFCVTFLNGRAEVHHDFREETVNGGVRYVCSSCGKVRDCPHTDAAWQDTGAGSCGWYCPACDKYVGEPEEHDWEIITGENTETHEKRCRRCGTEQAEAHAWSFVESTAACTADGETVWLCPDCGMEKREPAPAAGHQPDQLADAREHWQVCGVCGEELPGSREAHEYQWDGYDWVCAVCFMYHEDQCGGAPVPLEEQCDCSHEVLRCGDCGLLFRKSGEGAFAERYHHVFDGGSCVYCGAPDPDAMPGPDPVPVPDPDPGTDGGENSGNADRSRRDQKNER